MLSQQSFNYNTTHPDRLTSFGGTSISYNAMGCPTTYDGYTTAWTGGKLARLYDDVDVNSSDSSDDIRFTYNAYGYRTSKVYEYNPGPDYSGNFTVKLAKNYCYDQSGRLIRETSTEYFTESANINRELVYLYDESGIIGVTYIFNGSNSKVFYFRKNLQGDVIAIYDSYGIRKAEYAYDAYGNCEIVYSGTDTDIAQINPIRYRGYYYDDETELYYLNARYYSPKWRRFISPDDTAYLDPETPNGLNLYAYCYNDPVNYADPSGHNPEWWHNLLIGSAIIAGTALLVTALTFSGGTAGAFLLSAGKAALVGLEIAATAGVVSGAIRTGLSLEKNISNGNSFSDTIYNAGRSFLAGFGDGFLNGAKYYASTAIISMGAYKLLGLYNGGYGLIKENYMIGYQNPKVLGITLFSSRVGSKFRVDLDPAHSIHYHYGKTKKIRDIHRGSWIGGIFIGIYSGINGVVY